eukprot:235899_1
MGNCLLETEIIPRHNQAEWFNNIEKNKHESIDSNVIQAIQLTDFNQKKHIYTYQYNEEFTRSCHWLIPNLILIGADPYRDNDKEGFVQSLVNNGITEFISLHEWEHQTYKDILQKCYKDDDGGVRAIDEKLISLPIPDFEVLDNAKTIQYIDELIKIVFQTTTKKVYIHCYGGHGRSGVIGSLLLQAIYGMDSMTAIKFLNHIHWV